MGWLTQPLPAGGTFTDSVTGRTWTISGSGLELWQTYQPEFSYEFDPYPYTGWVTPGFFDPKMLSFSGTRQVVDWWRGPRAMNLSARFVSDEAQPSALALSTLIRIRVKVGTPAGGENTRTLFEGRVIELRQDLTGDNVPIVTVQIADDMGWNTQAAFDPSVNFASAQTGNMIGGIYTNWMNTRYPLVLGGPDNGVTQTFNTGTGSNVFQELARLMRGELGVLWPARDGRTVFNSGDWYVFRPNPIAIIGTDVGGKTGTWYLPLSRSLPIQQIRELFNEVKWTGPAPQGSSGASQPTTVAQYGRRVWSDNTYVNTNINQTASVSRLSSVLGLIPRERVQSVTFPADLSIDAMNYATQADPTDLIFVTKEWFEDKWNSQVEAHVLGVTQQWSQANGWWTTLKVTEALIPYDFGTPGRETP